MQQPGRDLCEFGERGLELALDRVGSERRRKGAWRQSSANSQFPKAQVVSGAAAPKRVITPQAGRHATP
jgi:hypothetical protein